MRNTNKINLALWGMFLALFICAPASSALISWDVSPIGNGSNPQIYGKKIVWQNAGEIFLYDASVGAYPDSINGYNYNNSNPQIYENYICWEGVDNDDGVYKVFLYNGIQCIPLDMLDGTFDGFTPLAPQVSDKLVVWYAYDGTNYEIYAYDIGTRATDKLENNGYDNQNPQVSGYNVAWEANNFPETVSLFFYDALDDRMVNVREIEGTDNWHPQIYGDTIAWWGGIDYPAPEYYKLELFMFDESDNSAPVQITEDHASTTLVYPQIWDKNIVWEGLNRSTIDFYDGITEEITHISNPCLFNKCPQIWQKKVVWEGYTDTPSYNYEIYFWDGDNDITYNLSYNGSINDQAPQIYNYDVVWHANDGRIFFAEAIIDNPADIEVSPSSYYFGEILIGSKVTTTVTISNVGGEDLLVTDIYLQEGAESDFSIRRDPSPTILEPNESVQLTIVYRPSTLGIFQDTLVILSDDPDESLIEVPLIAVGTILLDIEVSPMEFDFGQVPLNQTETTVIKLSNAGNLPIDVNSIDFQEGSSSDFSIVSLPDPNFPFTLFTRGKDSKAEVEIAFTPSAIGPVSAILEIGSNDPDENPVEVELSGTGISP